MCTKIIRSKIEQILLFLIILLTASAFAQKIDFKSRGIINSNAEQDIEVDFEPSFAFDDQGRWMVVWSVHQELPPPAIFTIQLFLSRSTDRGFSWSGREQFTPIGSDEEPRNVAPKLVTDKKGRWLLAWQSQDDLSEGLGADWDLLYSISDDYGDSWLPPSPLNTDANIDSHYDRELEIATDENGNWIAVWEAQDRVDDSPVVYFSRSEDNGESWTAPEYLGGSNFRDGDPYILYLADTRWLAAWNSYNHLDNTIGSDLDILFSHSLDSGATWLPIKPLNNYAAIDAPESTQDRDHDVYVDCSPTGTCIAAWYIRVSSAEEYGEDADIIVARSSDFGFNWDTPFYLTDNAKIDIEGDRYPRVANNGANRWVVLWFSEDHFSGTINFDPDIVYSFSLDDGLSWSETAPMNDDAEIDIREDGTPLIQAVDHKHWVSIWSSQPQGSLNDIEISIGVEIPETAYAASLFY